MATKGTLSLKGLEKYLEDLAKAGANVDEVAAEALLTGGEEVKAEMQRRVPKDTYNLQDHIAVEGPTRDGNFVYVSVGVITADKKTAIYGNVQEFGSSSVSAQPYIRPSFAAKKSVVKKALMKIAERFGLK